MKAGHWADACPKLEASQKLDPGVGTLYRLAYCYAGDGKTASAWSAFNDCEAMARKAGDHRADDAAKQAKLIEPTLSKLLLNVSPEARAQGVGINRDGRPIDPSLWATPLPVDPGQHTLEATKAGMQAWRTTFPIDPKPGVTTLWVPGLQGAGQAAPVPAPVPAPAFWSAQRIAGTVVGGAGLGVGAVLVAVFGGLAANKKSASSSHCVVTNGVTACDPTGLALRTDGKQLADGADVGLAVGGAALVTGIILFATAPSGDTDKRAGTGSVRLCPNVSLAGPGLAIEGAW